MSTYGQLVYMVNDIAKLLSDDSTYTEEHIAFMLDKTRALLLKKDYSTIKREMPESNMQSICVDLEAVERGCDETYLKSTSKIPYTIFMPRIYSIDGFSSGMLTFVSPERFEVVGYNKWLQSIIYCTIKDGILMIRSANPMFASMERARITGVFENPRDAIDLLCDEDGESKRCDWLDADFPLEESYVSTLLEAVIAQLYQASIRPKDPMNNSQDDTADIHNFIANNVKSALAKQLS